MSDNRSGATTILLICREGKSRQLYQTKLDFPGVLLVCVQTLAQFFRREVYCPLQGILVDMPTYMRCGEEEKLLLTDLVGLFPALRLRCNEESGEIRTLPFGTAFPGNTTLTDFVQKNCTTFAQRKIRTSERSLQNLPAVLNISFQVEDISGSRSMTTNISPGGCFLVRFEPCIVGEQGWLTLPELKDNSYIKVEVCWTRAWGECHSFPGMGIRFIDLTESQKAELSTFGGRSLMLED
ncbi:MAG: PilZ domain-containing protein [Desulfuromonadaceae bacterium]|nr:PilZ domain-containing protein [Desulfuromonadaceae bacterium]